MYYILLNATYFFHICRSINECYITTLHARSCTALHRTKSPFDFVCRTDLVLSGMYFCFARMLNEVPICHQVATDMLGAVRLLDIAR